jgi:hypothetical protein
VEPKESQNLLWIPANLELKEKIDLMETASEIVAVLASKDFRLIQE